MLLSRLVMCPTITATVARTTGRQFVQRQPNLIIRNFQRDSRDTLSRAERIAERQTLRERAMAPVGPNGERDVVIISNKYNKMYVYIYVCIAYGIGKGAVAGGAVVGLGALCFYGLGFGSSDSVVNNSL